MSDANLAETIPLPAGTPRRLAEWIRLALARGGPGRKLHYAAVARGELHASRLGKRWLYVTPEDYAEWLQRCRIETAIERQARLVHSADALHREQA